MRVLLLWAALTAWHVPVWHDDVTLWTAAVRVQASPRALINLAGAEWRAGDLAAAEQHYHQALLVAQDGRRPPATQTRAIRIAAASLAGLRGLRGAW